MSTALTRRQALLSGARAAAAISSLNVFPGLNQAGARTSSPSVGGQDHTPPLSIADYEALAQQRMSHVAWEYFTSGSADEITLKWNREAYLRLRLKPRVLADVSQIDTSIRIFGQQMPHPILLAPTSTHFLANPEGEVATVRGAGAANATMVASTVSNRSIEEITHAATRPVWFQLYVEDDHGKTRELIQRAEATGCQALCITVDLPYTYARNREARILPEAPQFPFPNLEFTGGPGAAGRKGRSRRFTWVDLEWIRSFSKTPILLKGVLNPDDADLAVKAGASGIIVSNHGGRALDSVPATIEALPAVTARVAGRIPVLTDGGIRRGTDVLKALGFGASAVLVGRPYLYGLGVAGAEGVCSVIEILCAELQAAMGLCGVTSIAAINGSVLWEGP